MQIIACIFDQSFHFSSSNIFVLIVEWFAYITQLLSYVITDIWLSKSKKTLHPHVFSIRMRVVSMYPFLGSMAMGIFAYGITDIHLPYVGLYVKNDLCQTSLHIQ